jgi:hypothetical protein
MNLTSGEVGALRKLSFGRNSERDFVKIAAANALTGFGLATRTRQGWAITAAGQAWLSEQSANDQPGCAGEIIAFARPAAAAVQ